MMIFVMMMMIFVMMMMMIFVMMMMMITVAALRKGRGLTQLMRNSRQMPLEEDKNDE